MPERSRATRRHRGDIMSVEKRSALMAKIKGRNTGPEREVAKLMAANGLRPTRQVRGIPGRPDFAFLGARVAIFVDGDFWHGWRFPIWRDKLSAKWEAKIEANRHRDARNFQKLRYRGWKVIRLWEHQIERDPNGCIARVKAALEGRGLGSRLSRKTSQREEAVE